MYSCSWQYSNLFALITWMWQPPETPCWALLFVRNEPIQHFPNQSVSSTGLMNAVVANCNTSTIINVVSRRVAVND